MKLCYHHHPTKKLFKIEKIFTIMTFPNMGFVGGKALHICDKVFCGGIKHGHNSRT